MERVNGVRLSGFDTLSFDCYGTLIDWERGISDVLLPWSRRRGLHMDNDALLASYAKREARLEVDSPRALYPEILQRAFGAMGRELGATVDAHDARVLRSRSPPGPHSPTLMRL